MQPIVGRDAELEAVERFLDTLDGVGRALVIAGEAGIGKTALWDQAVATAQARGYQVLQARPAESEAQLSYSALADILGVVFDDRRADLPQPQQQALDTALLRSEAADAHERTTATALVTILAALAAETPTVVAVDDVQWLDAASARALEFAARRMPARVGLLVTLRSDGSVDTALGLDRALPDERRETEATTTRSRVG